MHIYLSGLAGGFEMLLAVCLYNSQGFIVGMGKFGTLMHIDTIKCVTYLGTCKIHVYPTNIQQH